jgi:hypothetical protein
MDTLAVGNVVAGEVVQYQGARLPENLDLTGLMAEAMQFAGGLDE